MKYSVAAVAISKSSAIRIRRGSASGNFEWASDDMRRKESGSRRRVQALTRWRRVVTAALLTLLDQKLDGFTRLKAYLSFVLHFS